MCQEKNTSRESKHTNRLATNKNNGSNQKKSATDLRAQHDGGDVEAQRLLDNLELEAEQEKKKADVLKKDRERRSVKGGAGKCQGCGLKKCKKSCLFYS